MASVFDKVAQLARSPKGQQTLKQVSAKAQQLAKDPRTKARIDDARRRFTGGRGTGGGPRPTA
ncbi:hypothetical protein [Geodermatophilus sp. SYSU D00684]